ncbi:uncharacterized protein LOC125063737 [Pieris napi]|uniref:uncharacterized protein LOC125063737 n=1 Tax=Pieris napi TaxID=78633 RepID=UPI001FBAA77E|nr:uncharacterized protein LOC125063737 [Pieris napi]
MQLCLILIATGCAIINASPSNMAKLNAIKFPEHIDDDVPEPCRNLTYCTIPPKNYPFKEFNEMFKFYKPAPQPKLVLSPVSINTRGEFDDDCETKISYEPLYTVREKRGDHKWRNVIQASEHDYIQSVRLETCQNTEATCFSHLEELQDSYSTYCFQKYNVWKVLVDKPGHDPEEIETELPVCCSCQYKSKQVV